ncbi:NTP transferase domain-containing protein [Lewinella sp. W8]|uniref:NTP transferase domain-containing protein n=1 Tax=Lewinella sp. W8 TaxID=2528208 RepID=UPI0010680CF8|nr:NTP transferase domain-containing protein [Lewinella sp. W8]MTB51535.1 NTP transferase domain-containing protein [Lewinella sp. W8]
MMPHQKHPKVSRPVLGHYGRTEFAFVGSTCARMEDVMEHVIRELADAYRGVLVTGDHGTKDWASLQQFGKKQIFAPSAFWNDYDDKLLGRESDFVLVNGNHYPAARQIVFVDPNKAGTLERRREQLTDVAAIVMCPGADDLPGWLKEHLGDGAPVPCPLERSKADLTELIKSAVEARIPPIQALILAGGKSQRMGEDKRFLTYRSGLTELERMVSLCRDELGLTTHLSVSNADDAPLPGVPTLADRFLGLGPLGAICSAFLREPDVAWLVLPCDLPLLEADTLRQLIAARAVDKVATAVKGSSKPFPEPLVTIYEPRAYPRLLSFLGLGYSCPRKMLINSEVAHFKIADETPIRNANTPEERLAIERLLK